MDYKQKDYISEISHLVAGLVIVIEIRLGIGKRKEVAERPGDEIFGIFKIPLTVLKLADARRDITRKRRLFRNDQLHVFALLPLHSSCLIQLNTATGRSGLLA